MPLSTRNSNSHYHRCYAPTQTRIVSRYVCYYAPTYARIDSHYRCLNVFPTTKFSEKIKSSMWNEFRAKGKSILKEWFFKVCTRRAEASEINLSGTLPMKPESTPQTSLKVMALIKLFYAGRKKQRHFCFSAMHCRFCPVLSTTSCRDTSADVRASRVLPVCQQYVCLLHIFTVYFQAVHNVRTLWKDTCTS